MSGAHVSAWPEGPKRRIALNRGLYLLKYHAAGSPGSYPFIRLYPETDTSGAVELISSPGTELELAAPGDCIVARATHDGVLVVHVMPRQSGGSVAATVKVERIGNAQAAEDIPAAGDVEGANIEVLAHVTRLGDVLVPAKEWVAGPARPARIEGLQVNWRGRPADVQLCYAVSVGSAPSRETELVYAGGFAGTRGRALPIVGLFLELVGEGAARFQITAEGVFLGAPLIKAEGGRIKIAGPTGTEPLVGLKLEITDLTAVAAERAAARPVPHVGATHVNGAHLSDGPYASGGASGSAHAEPRMPLNGKRTEVGPQPDRRAAVAAFGKPAVKSSAGRVRVFRNIKPAAEAATGT